MKVLPCFFMYIVCNLFRERYCYHAEALKFELKTVDGVFLGDPEQVSWFPMPEDRQKLCFYAAVKAKVPWVDFSYVPYWQQNLPSTSKYDDYNYGMLCKGLPDFYLLRRIISGFSIQIRLVRSTVDYYRLENSKIPLVKPIALRKDLYEKFKDTDFNHMKLNDRKHLCTLASRKTKNQLYFVDGNVEKAQPYEFEYAHEKITDIAIPCPTSPKLYLRRGDVQNTIQLVISKSGIDEYNFEKDALEATAVFRASEREKSDSTFFSFTQLNADDRVKLCILARQWNGVTTLDTDRNVTEAQVYTFQYSGKQKEEHNLAILCPVLPRLYLRLVDKSKIKLTFIQLEPHFYVSGVQVVEFFYPKGEDEKTLKDDKKLHQHHVFTDLDDETRWRMCHIAQRHILQSKNRIYFRFTLAENALLPFKLLLTPNSRSMKDPDLYVMHFPNKVESSEDIAYRCTRWPEMYIRLGTSKNEIEIIFRKSELSVW